MLGIKIRRNNNCNFLSLKHYAEKLIKKFNSYNVAPLSTPYDYVLKKNRGLSSLRACRASSSHIKVGPSVKILLAERIGPLFVPLLGEIEVILWPSLWTFLLNSKFSRSSMWFYAIFFFLIPMLVILVALLSFLILYVEYEDYDSSLSYGNVHVQVYLGFCCWCY